MRFRGLSGLLIAGLVHGFWGCSSSDSSTPNTTQSGGGSTNVAGSSTGGSGGTVVGTSGSSGNGGQVTAGAGGNGGMTGGAGGVAAGTGGGGSAGMAAGGSGGAAAGAAGAGGGGGAGGAGVTAPCADHPEYDLCIDFEGPTPAAWTGGNNNAVVTTDFAHGGHSYQLYKCNDATAPTEANKCADAMSGGKFTITDLGAITNQIWGRFYVHFSPGAPGGHGNIVGAFQGGAWYEIGWQFDGIMGVWHNGGENPVRSMPYIVDQWYCVELFFDGAAAAMPKWYIDGMEAGYYKDEPNNPTQPITIDAFDTIEVGFTPYAGLEIRQPDGVGDQTEMRMLNGMWIDDIAFDTERIGCIAGPAGQ